MLKILVFPGKNQLEKIIENGVKKHKLVIITRNSLSVKNSDKTFMTVHPKDYEIIHSLRSKDAELLCCHEEGIYWLRNNNSPLWKIGFDENYLNLLEKRKFKNFLISNKINTAELTETFDEFPVVAKPNIGFGSMGIMKITCNEEMEKYKSGFNDMINESGIKKYLSEYFKHTDNTSLFERYISGDFYRTPFIVKNTKSVSVFPVRGVCTRKENNSDFHWIDFEYNPGMPEVTEQTKEVADRLCKLFSLRDGSYVMEFIIGSDNKLYLLEFSPRQTSERISHLIELATGISVENMAYELFEKNEIHHDSYGSKSIRLRLEELGICYPSLESEYSLIECKTEKNVYGSIVNCCYYGRI